MPRTKRHVVTARKHGGDDAYSWAVFLDGRPVITGLSRQEVPYWKSRIREEASML
jgi:hypothetical protein